MWSHSSYLHNYLFPENLHPRKQGMIKWPAWVFCLFVFRTRAKQYVLLLFLPWFLERRPAHWGSQSTDTKGKGSSCLVQETHWRGSLNTSHLLVTLSTTVSVAGDNVSPHQEVLRKNINPEDPSFTCCRLGCCCWLQPVQGCRPDYSTVASAVFGFAPSMVTAL